MYSKLFRESDFIDFEIGNFQQFIGLLEQMPVKSSSLINQSSNVEISIYRSVGLLHRAAGLDNIIIDDFARFIKSYKQICFLKSIIILEP